jgi:hypothetical protein
MSATITSPTNVISIVPIFRSGGFDAEATQNLGKAYDIACRSLHAKGRPPAYKKPLPRRLLKPRSAVSAIPTGLQR